MASMPNPDRPRLSTLAAFLLLSLVVHAAVLLWLRVARFAVHEPEAPPLVVKLAPPPPAAPGARPKAPPAAAPSTGPAAQAAPAPSKNQIVAPSDQENEQPPLGRAFLSDRDNRAEKETVKRGNPDAGKPADQPPPKEAVANVPKPPPPPPAVRPAPPRAAPPAAAKPAPAPRGARPRGDTVRDTKPLPGLDQLFAPPSEVLAQADRDRRTSDDRASADAGDPAEASDDRHRDLVSAPPPAPGIFGGQRGTFDSLPDVAQGSLTMLNTKADRFAPFVRRVGTRVFQNMIIYQRRDLGPDEVMAAHDTVTVRATLDRNGKLKDIDVEERSGSLAVDQTLLDALRQAAFDANPPPSAANAAGEFEFIFQAQLAAVLAPGPGGAQLRAVESRMRVGLL